MRCQELHASGVVWRCLSLALLLRQETALAEHLRQQVEALEAAAIERDAREKQLVAEMKRKGDTARQIIASKDEELEAVRLKLRAAVEAAKTAVDEREKLQIATQRAEQQIKMQQAQQAQQHILLQQKQLQIMQLKEQQQSSTLSFMSSFFSAPAAASSEGEGTLPPHAAAPAAPAGAAAGPYDQILELSPEAEDDLSGSEHRGHAAAAAAAAAAGAVAENESAALTEERKFTEMKEELARRALQREAELMREIKHLKMEVPPAYHTHSSLQCFSIFA